MKVRARTYTVGGYQLGFIKTVSFHTLTVKTLNYQDLKYQDTRLVGGGTYAAGGGRDVRSSSRAFGLATGSVRGFLRAALTTASTQCAAPRFVRSSLALAPASRQKRRSSQPSELTACVPSGPRKSQCPMAIAIRHSSQEDDNTSTGIWE